MADIPKASPEEAALFRMAVRGLPDMRGFLGTGVDWKGKAIPAGVSAHNIRPIMEALEIVKPGNILEIGFALGYSASIFLMASDACLTSVDSSDWEETENAAGILGRRYPGRFRLVLSDSRECLEKVKGRPYDMIFIDGNHLEPGVTSDIKLGLSLGIPWFFFDDTLPEYGPGVMPSIANTGIRVLHTWFNMALGMP